MFITGPSWGANSIQITELEYRLLESVAEKILKDFPPAKYYYVGVGRSPSALIAYLEAIAPGTSGHLPVSKAKWANSIGVTPERVTLIRNHFLRFLPPETQLGGRKILLIDYTESGLGLKWTKDFINKFVLPQSIAESFAIVWEEHDHQYLDVSGKFVFKDEKLLENFAGQKYDEFAAYGSAVVSISSEIEKLPGLTPNPKYGLLVTAVRQALVNFGLTNRLCRGLF